MQCPNCRSHLNTIEVVDNYGLGFEIEQCPSCGGFWFDKDELYRIPIEVAFQLDTPTTTRIHEHGLKCPHEEVLLSEFKDPNLPPDVVIFRCPACGGIFLFKGQLYAYKDYQKNKALRSLELSRKMLSGMSVFFVFLLFSSFLVFSGMVIKAESVNTYFIDSTRTKIASLILILSIILIIFAILRVYFMAGKKGKRGSNKR